MNKIMEQAIAIKDDIVSYRRTIHANPEVGTELPMRSTSNGRNNSL